MLKKWVILGVFVLVLVSLKAQNEGQYTHFMYNRLSYNPGYAGSSGDISITALYRNQWMGLTLQPSVVGGKTGSTPTNMLLSFDMPVSFLHGGVGLVVNSEKYGFHNNIAVALDYAFRIYWGPGNLSAALEVDLYNYQFDHSALVGSDDMTGKLGDAVSSTADPLINGEADAQMMFDVSTGIYYQIPGLAYVSLSVKNLLGSKNTDLAVKNNRTLYLMGGYEYRFPYNPSFMIKPSVLVKTADFSVFQAEAACLLDYENLFWGGLGYRVGDAFTFLAGVNLMKIMQLGVAYDLTTSKLGFAHGRSVGSLEVYLNAHFQITTTKQAPQSYRNTRYLL